jgi:hypothetical protein
MKRFMKTKFVLSIKDTSLQGIKAQVLQQEYDKFVILLFSENATKTNCAEYRNTLVYTRVELSDLTKEVSEKKYNALSRKSY